VVKVGKKVLVVDDEKLIVKGIRFSLEQDGMEVDCAYDGEEALEAAKKKEYDIILFSLSISSAMSTKNSRYNSGAAFSCVNKESANTLTEVRGVFNS
jgi:DNA-binding NarL/FixJ family response regulator